MFPEWIVRILEGLGLPGAIIFVLLTALISSLAYIRSMQSKADKVYSYRLAERDTLNKALTDTATVLKDMLKVTEDRNELTEEQAKLIERQAQAFELLKVTVLAQYDSIKDHNNAAAQAVASMAEAIRQLSAIVLENRNIALTHVQAVNKAITDMGDKILGGIAAAHTTQLNEVRTLLRGGRQRRKVAK